MDDILTVSDAARLLSKTPGTLRRWIDTGIIQAKKIPAGKSGVYALLKTDVLEWIVSHPKGPEKNPAKRSRSPQLPML